MTDIAPNADVIDDDAALAARLAEGAGRLLIALRESRLLAGKPLGAAGDAIAQQFLARALHAHRPADGLLSEEAGDDLARLRQARVWIIDPVDGTREYAEADGAGWRSDWAVHVGLAIAGTARVGAVALPALGQVWRSDRPRALPPAPERLRIAVSRSRPPEIALAVAARLGATLVAMGSAGVKAMAILRGEADIYLHAGGQAAWDNCAPVAIALAHGLHASRIDGAPLVYNRAETSVPDLLICRHEHAEAVLAAIAA